MMNVNGTLIGFLYIYLVLINHENVMSINDWSAKLEAAILRLRKNIMMTTIFNDDNYFTCKTFRQCFHVRECSVVAVVENSIVAHCYNAVVTRRESVATSNWDRFSVRYSFSTSFFNRVFVRQSETGRATI